MKAEEFALENQQLCWPLLDNRELAVSSKQLATMMLGVVYNWILSYKSSCLEDTSSVHSLLHSLERA